MSPPVPYHALLLGAAKPATYMQLHLTHCERCISQTLTLKLPASRILASDCLRHASSSVGINSTAEQ